MNSLFRFNPCIGASSPASEPDRHKSRGFTLLEMMLALVIFTLVSLSAWQILTTITNARDVQAEHEKRLKELDYAFLLMKQDFRQMVDRGKRVDGKVSKQGLFSGDSLFDTEGQAITFVRAGWHNADDRLPRSTLQRVYYRLQENVVERAYDRILDSPTTDEPEFKPLLTGVNTLTFQFYYKGVWQDELKQDTQPEAVAVQMELEKAGEIERRFILPSSWRATDGEV